jgi:hypothetical protein
MKKWADELNIVFSKEDQKTHGEMFNIPGHNGNANQNYVKILPHSC